MINGPVLSIMVCGAHSRSNLQITPGGHGPEKNEPRKGIKVNCGAI